MTFTWGSTVTAWADSESAAAVRPSTRGSDAGTVDHRTWRNTTGPHIIHRRTWRAGSTTTVVHAGTWRTGARPQQPRVIIRPTKVGNKRIARSLLQRRDWPSREFQCLDSLWTRESNWNHEAYNRSSGAYGIPQALPAGKMSGAGKDWRHNPATQIRWGLKYIKGRYGRPCGAWGHFRSHNWY
ncbi:transglycosylase SLT domain-containing protein [Thermoactinospora rubra]|uniref:aggregation-promoting factor C-terminal-like domain-containing protein n=1 Tax=Thermoactinospora rubra TaxID=1088767 RepID=UPI00197D1EAB|nr:transglycosylase SLT domain-containing protein [Thermoactinospora rubra]